MGRLFIVILVSVIVGLTMVGVSPALAQSGDNTEEVVTSPETASENQTIPKEFAVNDTQMEELDRLVRALKEAENKNDPELIEVLQEKIRVIKEDRLEQPAQASGTLECLYQNCDIARIRSFLFSHVLF